MIPAHIRTEPHIYRLDPKLEPLRMTKFRGMVQRARLRLERWCPLSCVKSQEVCMLRMHRLPSKQDEPSTTTCDLVPVIQQPMFLGPRPFVCLVVYMFVS